MPALIYYFQGWSRRSMIVLLLAAAFAAALSIPQALRGGRGLPHEGRHAEIAREMLWSGDLAVPRLLGKPYHEKPPLFYWLAAGSFRLSGVTDLESARRVNIALGAAGVLAAWALARMLAGPLAGILAAVFLASMVDWVRESAAARTDMGAAAFGAIGAAFLWWGLRPGTEAMMGREAARWVGPILGGVCLALSLLAKGPVAPLVVTAGLALMFLLDRKTLRHPSSAAVVALLSFLSSAGGWALWTWQAGGEDYLRDLLFGEGLSKAWDHYPRSWAYYLAVIPARVLPFTVLLPCAVLESLRRWGDPDLRRRTAARLPLLWMSAGLVILSLIPSKRSQYVLPLLPFAAVHLALFAAAWWEGTSTVPYGPCRLTGWILASGTAAGGAAAVAAGILVDPAHRALLLAAGAALGLCGIRALVWMRMGRPGPVLGIFLAAWAAGIFLWGAAGLFSEISGEEVLLRHIRSAIPPGARAVAYQSDAEPFALAWPTVPERADTPQELERAIGAGADHVLIPAPVLKDLPPAIAARLEFCAAEGAGDRKYPLQLWRGVRR